MSTPAKPTPTDRFQPPRGTRDFYPIEMARRLWLEDKWRRTGVRHGFDEIDGPTFEHLDLYTVKSGEGIVNELFSFTRAGGETPFALRPEFTPTLARMVADRANALPKPIKWFSIGPYFRAERPQRGRLREFLQWNVDVLGDPTPEADAEAIACCVASLEALGLTPRSSVIRLNSRRFLSDFLCARGAGNIALHDLYFQILDQRSKLPNDEFAKKFGDITIQYGGDLNALLAAFNNPPLRLSEAVEWFTKTLGISMQEYGELCEQLLHMGLSEWCVWDISIVRGLAYYTGTVFEVHETTGAERAIAGGGRYDNLVELFGGPPTPAVGFAMGDVVISLVLQDKGLMPSDDQIARDLGLAPDAFVVAANDEAEQRVLRPVLAALRRAGLHARRSYRATRNIGKLLQEADKAGARYAVILESPDKAQVKNLHSKEQVEIAEAAPQPGDPARLVEAIVRHILPPR